MTTSYERLREECNKRLPERTPKCVRCENIVPKHSDFCRDGLAHLIENRPLSITDVLRVLGQVKGIAYLKVLGEQLRVTDDDSFMEYFLLSLPLSAPANAAACEAVYKLITETV